MSLRGRRIGTLSAPFCEGQVLLQHTNLLLAVTNRQLYAMVLGSIPRKASNGPSTSAASEDSSTIELKHVFKELLRGAKKQLAEPFARDKEPDVCSPPARTERRTGSSFRANESDASSPPVVAGEEEQLRMMMLSYLDCFQRNDDPLSHFDAHGEIIFKEAHMNVHGFADELDRIYRSFPDLNTKYGESQVLGPDCISVVVQVSGTHTGAPYSFGPFPEIAPTGTKVQLDRE